MFLATLFISSIALAGANPLLTNQTMHRRAITAKYSYAGLTGPLGWTGMDPHNWAACATSDHQSPINLDASFKLSGARPQFSAATAPPMPCLWNGHTFKVNMTDSTVLTKYGGEDYKLAQFHFHTPAEHFIDGDFFPLEMHFVHHRVRDDSRLVIGVFFSLTKGKSHPFLTGAIKNIDKVSGDKQSTSGPLPFAAINNLLTTSDLYHYTGSLTVPPCTSDVNWIVAKNPLNVDLDDWYKLKQLMKFNARYVQNTPGQMNLIKWGASTLPQSH